MTVTRSSGERLKVGVIGGGAITQVAHLPVLKKLRTIEVPAICDTDLPKARALADRFGVKDAFDDIEDLLRYEALDAVVICTPNHLHESHILAALSAGLHVLVEKPLAMSAASAQRIVRAAEKRGRVVMVGMNHRYRPDVQIVRSFVQGGELGELDSIRAGWHVARPTRAPMGWRQRRDESGGGAMLDLGLTMIDLCFWMAGNPVPLRVSASLSYAGRGDRAVEQSGSALVHCEGGLAMFIDVTWRYIGEGEYFGAGVRGTRGSANLNPLRVWKEMHGTVHDVSPSGSGARENLFIAAFRAQWAHFLAAVRGEAPPPPLEEQVIVQRVIEAIYRSAADGRDVTL